MNVKAAHFVRQLRGLTPDEKAIAFAMAVHASYREGFATMSMQTLALESGLQTREGASRIVRRLESYGIVQALSGSHSKGGRGQTTTYVFTLSVNRDSGITVSTSESVTHQSQFASENCDREGTKTVIQNAETVTGGSHKGFKVIEGESFEGSVARGSSSSEGTLNCDDDDDRGRPNPSGQVEQPSRVDKLVEKAKHKLIAEGEDPDFVSAAIDRIDVRVVDRGTEPASVKYYLQAYANLRNDPFERQELSQLVERGRALREQYASMKKKAGGRA